MKIYNTASRQIEEFQPIEDGRVKLYTCGPTVYDYAQIGNLRAFVFDDTLRRVLQAGGYDVKHVMNITDVGHLASDEDEGEDKLEKGAKRENKTVWEVADYFINQFLDDAAKLNILEPNGYHGPHGAYARATDFIAQQIEIVRLLLDKGFAYQSPQAIYFDVSKLDDYGKLTGQNLSDKEVAARAEVVSDEHKRSPQDFALWFFAVGRFADHSMRWPSPWGEGFPGWHLECSAIIHATLGEPIDIHTGGVDHIGTHHTNEIAQTEAAYGVKLANYWMHNEHLLAGGQKMSKSKANYYTLEDIENKNIDALVLRLLYLQAHYRTQMNFNWESLEAAQKNLQDLRAMAVLRFQVGETSPQLEPGLLDGSKHKIMANLLNDLSTPAAIADALSLSGQLVEQGLNPHDAEEFAGYLKFLDDVFGLKLSELEDIKAENKQMISDREAARKSADWQKADELRDKLAAEGLEINDTERGPIWRRV